MKKKKTKEAAIQKDVLHKWDMGRDFLSWFVLHDFCCLIETIRKQTS